MVVGNLQGMKGSRMESLGWLHLSKKTSKRVAPKKIKINNNIYSWPCRFFPPILLVVQFHIGMIPRTPSNLDFKTIVGPHFDSIVNLHQHSLWQSSSVWNVCHGKKTRDKFWMPFFWGPLGKMFVWGGKGVRVSQRFTKYGGLCRIYFGDGRSSGWNSWLSCWWVAKRFQINMIWQLAAFFWHEFLHRFSCHSSLALLVLRRPSSAQQTHFCL